MRLLLAGAVFWVGVVTSAAVPAPTRGESEIKGVFSAFVDDWGKPGFPGLEAIITPDADFVVVTGKWLKGRSEVVAYHRDLLKTFYLGSHLTIDSIEVRMVDGAHAVAHLASTVHYEQDNKPIARPSLATVTLVSSPNGWLIDSFQNTITGGPGYMFNPAPALPKNN